MYVPHKVILYMNMKSLSARTEIKTLLIHTVFIFSILGQSNYVEAGELGFKEYVEYKEYATKIGRVVGSLQACSIANPYDYEYRSFDANIMSYEAILNGMDIPRNDLIDLYNLMIDEAKRTKEDVSWANSINRAAYSATGCSLNDPCCVILSFKNSSMKRYIPSDVDYGSEEWFDMLENLDDDSRKKYLNWLSISPIE